MLGNLTIRKVLLISLLIMLLTLVFKSAGQAPDLMAARLPNPDSYTKLVLLRDYTPQTGFQYMARDNAPYGSYLHWSMVHSWVMLKMAQGLTQLELDQTQALLWAGGGLTLLSMLLLALFVVLTVLNQGGRLAAIAAVLALTNSRTLFGYGQLLQITHHVFMLVPLAAAACCFLRNRSSLSMAPNAVRGPLADGLGGALLGLALWISPETMPFVVALAAIRAAVRLQFPQRGAVWPVAAGLMMALSLGWLVDPPPPTFSRWALDHISLSWLSLGLLLGALLLLADALVRRRVRLLVAVTILTVAAGAAALCWLWLVPGALAGPDGLIPAELKPVWWEKINELRRISTLSEGIAVLFLPVLAAALLAVTAWRKRCLWMGMLAFTALAYAGLAALHARMGAAAALATALAYGLALAQLPAFSAHKILPGRLRGQWPVILLILLPSLQASLSIGVAKGFETPDTVIDSAACSVADISKRLQALPAGIVLAPANSGPELLWRTKQGIVAGNYHHNTQGLLDLYRAWRSTEPDTQARQILDARGVNYVLACASGTTTDAHDATTLITRVKAGRNIDWLPYYTANKGWHLYYR